MPEPQRGDVWVVDLGLAAKVRPCLVLSVPVAEQDRALVTVVAHTTSPRGSRFEVAVTTRFLRPGVFDAQNLVTIPRAKLLRKLGVLAPTQLAAVEAAVRAWLRLSAGFRSCAWRYPANLEQMRSAVPWQAKALGRSPGVRASALCRTRVCS